MLLSIIVVFTLCFDVIKADTSCGDWVAFKDEKCFTILDNTFRTFDEAMKGCQALNTGDNRPGNKPTLPIILSREEQDFLTNYLFKSSKQVENFWLGARFVDNEQKFRWVDNSEVTFTNWDRSKDLRLKSGYCVEIEADESVLGQWLDEPCLKKNRVVCQKAQTWSLARLQEALLTDRKELEALKVEMHNDLESLKTAIQELKQIKEEVKDVEKMKSQIQDLEQMKENQTYAIPIGYVYTQLPQEKSPEEIWLGTKWTDVSATYAGVFFRVHGPGATFGKVQEENSPRLAQVKMSYKQAQQTDKSTIDTSLNHWSHEIRAGSAAGTYFQFLSFNMTGGEVRPRNMAIRIWKRTG